MTTILRGTLADGVAATLPAVRSYETDILGMDNLLSFIDANLPYVTLSGDDVSTLSDRTGNNAGFTQATAANKPDIMRQGLRGKSVIDLASADAQTMDFQGTFPTGSTSAHTEVYLFKLAGTPAAPAHLFSDNSPFSDSHVSFFSTSGEFSHGCGSGFAACATPAVVGEWAIYWAFYEGEATGGHRCGVQVNDGTLVQVTADGVPANTTGYLGRADAAADPSLNGQLAAMLLFDADLSETSREDDRAIIAGYFRARAGLI